MTLDKDIATTLYDRMLRVITGDKYTGMPSHFDTPYTMLVMAERGRTLRDGDYFQTNKDGEKNTSMLVDDILAENKNFTKIGGRVSEVYELMVNNATVIEPPPSPQLIATRERNLAILQNQDGSPTELHKREEAAKKIYQAALLKYQTLWAESDSPAKKKEWSIKGPILLSDLKQAYMDWGVAGREEIKSAEAQVNMLAFNQVSRVFIDEKLRLATFPRSDSILTPQIIPSDWYTSNKESWATYYWKQADFSTTHTTESESWSGSAGLDLGLWSFGGGAGQSSTRQALSLETSDIKLSFSFRFCTIHRPWMNEILFKLPNWNLGSLAGPGGIAGGSKPMMPLYPIAMLLVRDVTVEGNWGKTDSEAIQKVTTVGVSAGWGPFAVSGEYTYGSTTDTFTSQVTASGFKVPVIQVIGFVCARVPYCPPKIKISMASIKKVREAEKYLRPH